MASTTVQLPKPFADIERTQLMYPHPTFIEPMHNFTRALAPSGSSSANGGPTVWIKHEDTNSPLAYGGNKIRKFEYVIAEALRDGATHLVTVGGVQSNSQRQVVAVGNRVGLKTILVPDPAIGNPGDENRAAYDSAGNVQIDSILGATWLPSTSRDSDHAKAHGGLAFNIAADREMKRLQDEGHNPYFIPPGASLHSHGGLGFARWAFELEQQEKELDTRFDVIITASASGSTIGGMVAGFKLIEKEGSGGKKRRLIGMQATTVDVNDTVNAVVESAKKAAKLIGLNEDDINSDAFEIMDRFNAGAYARLDDKTKEGIKLLAETEGILTDPVYTGKAITGLIALAREGAFGDRANVLFVHTGGTPALSAFPSMR